MDMERFKGNWGSVIVVRKCDSPQGGVKDIQKMLVARQV